MSIGQSAISKYLKSYAESDCIAFADLKSKYNYVIVIPCCNEDSDFLHTVFKENKESSILVILVVNSPYNHENSVRWQKSNRNMIEYLRSEASQIKVFSESGSLLKFSDQYDVILVDRNSKGLQLNSKSAVGMARKIGCDIALKLIAEKIIETPWIYSTDADVVLPEFYFCKSVQNAEKNSAVVLDFAHYTDDDELKSRQWLYDFKIRYYHSGIVSAGSRYDYIPLGSTLIVNMQSYAEVRGFSKRSAGEDFYLLNKLNKIKPVKYLRNELTVKIRSRISDRVPFGTGPALAKMSELNSLHDYCYYNPQCFLYLKKWNHFLNSLWNNNGLRINKPDDRILSGLYQQLQCEKYFEKSYKQITSAQKWQDYLFHWFDAFRTLKAVHYFDDKFKRLNLRDLLKSDSFDKVCSPEFKKIINDFYG